MLATPHGVLVSHVTETIPPAGITHCCSFSLEPPRLAFTAAPLARLQGLCRVLLRLLLLQLLAPSQLLLLLVLLIFMSVISPPCAIGWESPPLHVTLTVSSAT